MHFRSRFHQTWGQPYLTRMLTTELSLNKGGLGILKPSLVELSIELLLISGTLWILTDLKASES